MHARTHASTDSHANVHIRTDTRTHLDTYGPTSTCAQKRIYLRANTCGPHACTQAPSRVCVETQKNIRNRHTKMLSSRHPTKCFYVGNDEKVCRWEGEINVFTNAGSATHRSLRFRRNIAKVTNLDWINWDGCTSRVSDRFHVEIEGTVLRQSIHQVGEVIVKTLLQFYCLDFQDCWIVEFVHHFDTCSNYCLDIFAPSFNMVLSGSAISSPLIPLLKA